MLQLTARRAGLRTEVALYRNGCRLAERSGMGRVLLRLPDQVADEMADEIHGGAEGTRPAVMVIAVLPGTISRAFLLVPERGEGSDGTQGLAGLARAQRRPFAPPPGSFAARLQAFQHAHPRLYAARHVVAAVSKVLFGLLGLALFLQLVLRRMLAWVAERLPEIDVPSIPWPDVDLPLPDFGLPDLPDLVLPSWLGAVLATSKYWLPVLFAIGLAVTEVKRRTRKRPDPVSRSGKGDDERDAHR